MASGIGNVTEGISKDKQQKDDATNKAKDAQSSELIGDLSANIKNMTDALKSSVKEVKDSFTNIFSRGIIGQLTAVNPAIAFGVQVLGQIKTTLDDSVKFLKTTLGMIVKPILMFGGFFNSIFKMFERNRLFGLENDRERGLKKGSGIAKGEKKDGGMNFFDSIWEILGAGFALLGTKLISASAALGALAAAATTVANHVFDVPDIRSLIVFEPTLKGALGGITKTALSILSNILNKMKVGMLDFLYKTMRGNFAEGIKNIINKLATRRFQNELLGRISLPQKIFGAIGTAFTKLVSFMGKFLAPFAKVFTKMIAIFEGLKGFTNVFDLEMNKGVSMMNVLMNPKSLISGIFLGMAGVGAAFIGFWADFLVDLPTMLLGKLLKAFGFEELGGFLEDTDFSKLIVDYINDKWLKLVDTVTSDDFSLDNLMGFIKDMLKSALLSITSNSWLRGKIESFFGDTNANVGIPKSSGNTGEVLEETKSATRRQRAKSYSAPVIVGDTNVSQNNVSTTVVQTGNPTSSPSEVGRKQGGRPGRRR